MLDLPCFYNNVMSNVYIYSSEAAITFILDIIDTMDRFGFSTLSDVPGAQKLAEYAVQFMVEDGKYAPKKATEFLQALYKNLTSSESSPVSKTMTIHVLKQITYIAETKFFNNLCTHPTLDFMYEEAKNIDPKKSIMEKGTRKFPGAPSYGQEYINLILQLLNFWGEKYAKGKNSSEPTKFKKLLTDLKNSAVTFPSTNEYFDLAQYKRKNKKYKDAAGGTAEMNESKERFNSGEQQQPGKLANQLNFTKQKIQLYLDDLQQAQDVEKIESIIQANHNYFEKQKKKFDNRGGEVGQDDKLMVDYFSVEHFLTEESRIFQKHAAVKDFQSYIFEIKTLVEQTFEKNNLKSRPSQPSQIVGEVVNYATPKNSPPPLPMTSNPNNVFSSGRGINIGSGNARDVTNDLFSRLQSRSKSPGVGFKAVQMQLEKEKQIAKKNPLRSTSRSPRNLNRSGTNIHASNASHLRQSRINPIFSAPPNPYVSYKNFEGQVVPESKELARALFALKKEQGARRFKISHFRQKNPLFQNEQLQIGYKSQPVYEPINGLNHFIMLNIYIGNKTDDGIKQFHVQYKADSNQLLYANPRTVDSIIPPGYQNKHDLMICPLGLPCSLMTMNISYKFKNASIYGSIVLPSSVMKFASYMKIGRSEFQANWRSSRKLKTNPFRLCKHLPPDSFNKWISTLENMTSYGEFSRQGSETDLEMFTMVIMLQKYQAVLKINIRPNLQVVVQLGVMDNNPQGLEYFRFYLQTLELVLKEVDM